MRRLWTLQGTIRTFLPKAESSKGEPSKADGLIAPRIEGALAKSLYFQFKDRAVDFAQEAARLKRLGSRDLRYKPIYENVALMVTPQPPYHYVGTL